MLTLNVVFQSQEFLYRKSTAQGKHYFIKNPDLLDKSLQSFWQHGYKPATMRKIAEQAKIPTGLIYTYYKSKETLFDAVLTPVLYDWERILNSDDHHHHAGEISGLSKTELECIFHLFDHRQEFIILMDKSAGTKYEQEKNRLILVIESHLIDHCGETADKTFIHIIANNFVDGLLQIVYHYQGKEWAIMILHKLSDMYLHGIGL